MFSESYDLQFFPCPKCILVECTWLTHLLSFTSLLINLGVTHDGFNLSRVDGFGLHDGNSWSVMIPTHQRERRSQMV